jgi:hypothetical protein
MGARWTPKWEIKEVEREGKRYEVCYDPQTTLYSCPLCKPCDVPLDDKSKGTYFFTEDDLLYHLLNHDVTAVKEVEVLEESDEDEVDGEEEEEE